MGFRAYMLLNTTDGRSQDAVQMLRHKAGVMLADRLEGRPDIIVMVEAPSRQRLAESIMPVIGCVDGITEDLCLMVTRENELPPDLSAPRNLRLRKRRREDANSRGTRPARRQPFREGTEDA